jgi:hypothetical protein
MSSRIRDERRILCSNVKHEMSGDSQSRGLPQRFHAERRLLLGDGLSGGKTMTKTDLKPLRMRVVWDVLERAKDAGDEMVVAACRRIIEADRQGWKKHGNPADLRLVLAFVE